MKFFFNASKVAAHIDMNRYETPEKCAIEMFEKYNIDKYNEALRRNNIVQEVININVDDSKAVLGTQNDVQNYLKDVKSKIIEQCPNVTEIEVEKMVNEKKSKVYCARGANSEEEDVKKINIRNPLQLDKKKHYLELKTDENNIILIIGAIDAKSVCKNDEPYVIESKRRQNRLFPSIPIYEIVQCTIYMKMLNVKKCLLVQNYLNESTEHWIELDELLWEKVVEKLKVFVKFMKLLMNDKDVQNKLVSNKINIYEFMENSVKCSNE